MFKRIWIGASLIALVVMAVPAYLLLSGSINAKSLSMILNVMTGSGVASPSVELIKGRFSLPEGFRLELFAGDLPKVRFLKFTPAGDLLATRPHAGDVQLLRRDHSIPMDKRLVEKERITLLSGLKRPHGIELHEGWLYIAESNAVGRVRFDSESGQLKGEYEVIISGLTDNGNHWTKTIAVGPDRKLYLSQGSTCNVCLEDDVRRATMYRYELDGSGETRVATGLRNSVGFDWAPWSGMLYATENGRDMLGDDFPPCELNAIRQGAFYGWPYFNGENHPDPDMGEAPAALSAATLPPAHNFRAHNAPLGMRFVRNNQWPKAYRRAALVALHGSWNRSTLDGYKVVSLHWREGYIEERDFLTGFEREGDVIGRPVDLAQGPDGAFYVSDDYAGAIYRVAYNERYDSPDYAGPAQRLKSGPVTAGWTKDEPPEWLGGADAGLMAVRGQALYEQHNCRSCHAPGSGKMALERLNERLNYADVSKILAEPRPPMPIFPLSEEDSRSLAVYLFGR